MFQISLKSFFVLLLTAILNSHAKAEIIGLTCTLLKEVVLGQSPPFETSGAGFRLVIDLQQKRVTLLEKEAFDVQISDELIAFKTQSPLFTGHYVLNRYTGSLLLQIAIGSASYSCVPANRKF